MYVGDVGPGHRDRVAEILRSTALFREDEVEVALEVFDGALDPFATGPLGSLHVEADADVTASLAPAARRLSRAEHSRAAEADYLLAGVFGDDGRLLGWAAYGPTPATDRTFDLYWIAVDRAAQGTGCGTMLLDAVESRLRDGGARLLVIETSARTDYDATRGFYARRGYEEAARVGAFYAPDDDRVILTKRFSNGPREGQGAIIS